MPQAARKVWTEETEERKVAPHRSHRRRTGKVSHAKLDTELRSKILILFLLFAVTATVTLIRSEVSAMRGYELVQIQREAAQLERENKDIELKIAQLKAPQRIKDLATNELGMVVPKEVYFAGGNIR